MHDYARHLIASTAAQVLPCRDNSTKAVIARQFLPYCAARLADGRAILLNREYKPLGWPTRRSGFVDYEAAEFESMRVRLPDWFYVAAPAATTDRGTFHYIYGKPAGEDTPWTSTAAAASYIARLEALLGCERITREGCQP